MKWFLSLFFLIFSLFSVSVQGMESKSQQRDDKIKVAYPPAVDEFFGLLKEFEKRIGSFEKKNSRDFKVLKEKFQDLIGAEGFDVNARNSEGYTLCCYATLSGCRAAFEALHEAKADFHQADKQLWTPLHIAAYLGYGYFVDYLLKSPQFKNRISEACGRKTELGQWPGRLAWDMGHEEIAKKLGYIEL